MNCYQINFNKIIHLSFFALVLFGINSCGLITAEVGPQSEKQTQAAEIRTPAEAINDQRITSTLKNKLEIDSNVSNLDINVDTYKSDVTLQGAVHDPDEIIFAVKLAQSVEGVRKVRAQLVVNN